MKNLLLTLLALMLVLAGCINFDEPTQVPPSTSGYAMQINGNPVKDTVKYAIGDVLLVEVLDKAGKKVISEVNFGNGNSTVVADKATDKYAAAGTYKLTAKVINTNPEVILTANVLIKKAVINPSGKDKIVLRIDSSYVNGVNTMTYGLNLNEIYGFDANKKVYVEASVLGKSWSAYEQFTEVRTIGGIKYLVCQLSGPNGDIRIGWYQYQTKDGSQIKQWANTSTSIFQKDGLPEFSVYNGRTYKLGTIPTGGVYTLKAGNESVANGSTIKVTEGSSVTFKVLNSSNQPVICTYTMAGVNPVVADSKTVVYSTVGTYDVKVETQTDATVLTAKVEVTRANAPVYTLKAGNETVASGSTIKVVEGASLTFKVLNSSNQAVMCTYTMTGSDPIVADSKTVVYPTAGTYDVRAETQSDGTLLTAKVEVAKAVVPNYVLKVGADTFASGSTIKITKGASLTFKIIDLNTGNPVSSTYTLSGSNPVVALSKTVTYSTKGNFDVRIVTETDLKVFTATVEVTDPPVKVYTLKIDNQAITNGSTVKLTKNTAAYFKVYDDAGLSVVAKMSFGEGTIVNTDGRAFTYSNAGTYQFQAEVDGAIIKATIEVAEPIVHTYTLKINGQAVANGATYKTTAKTSLVLNTVDETGVIQVVNYNFGDNTSETTDNAAKSYSTPGTYRLTVSKNSTTLQTVNIEVAASSNPTTYSFRINGLDISSETVYIVEGASTSIKVVNNADGSAVTAEINFGDGSQKVTTSGTTHSYAQGVYTLSALIGSTTITKRIEVTKPIDPVKPESIVLISSSVSGTTINAVLGLRCNAINNFSASKTTYVAGEIPGVNWKDYQLSEIVSINGVNYFKWSVSAPAGKYRMSWVQMRDGGTELYKGNWAHDLDSQYWNVGEGLFLFNLSIDGNSAKLTK